MNSKSQEKVIHMYTQNVINIGHLNQKPNESKRRRQLTGDEIDEVQQIFEVSTDQKMYNQKYGQDKKEI